MNISSQYNRRRIFKHYRGGMIKMTIGILAIVVAFVLGAAIVPKITHNYRNFGGFLLMGLAIISFIFGGLTIFWKANADTVEAMSRDRKRANNEIRYYKERYVDEQLRYKKQLEGIHDAISVAATNKQIEINEHEHRVNLSLSAMNERIDALEKKVNTLSRKTQPKRFENDYMGDRVDAAEVGITDLNGRVGELEEKVNAIIEVMTDEETDQAPVPVIQEEAGSDQAAVTSEEVVANEENK